MFNRKKKTISSSDPNFFNIPMIILSLISILFFSSIIYEMINQEEQDINKIVDLEKLMKKNSYEKKTGHRIQLEVLNGCGQKKIALMYKRFLREGGFDVLDAKNALSFDNPQTKILYHTQKREIAEYLSEILGVNDSLLFDQADYNLKFDVTVVIGYDFNELSSYNKVSLYYPEY